MCIMIGISEWTSLDTCSFITNGLWNCVCINLLRNLNNWRKCLHKVVADSLTLEFPSRWCYLSHELFTSFLVHMPKFSWKIFKWFLMNLLTWARIWVWFSHFHKILEIWAGLGSFEMVYIHEIQTKRPRISSSSFSSWKVKV